MREDHGSHGLREVRWVDEGYPIDDGETVVIVSISNGVESRARCSWHNARKYHRKMGALLEQHDARSREVVTPLRCKCCGNNT